MCPCIVRDKHETFVMGLQFALLVESECLSIGGERLNSGVHNGLVTQLKSGFLIDEDGKHIAGVVGMFSTIDDRTTLNRHTSLVGSNESISTYDTRFHVEVNLHLVTLLPLAVNDDVTV